MGRNVASTARAHVLLVCASHDGRARQERALRAITKQLTASPHRCIWLRASVRGHSL
jgi:hypothetical protein